jgi:hypothetical protein
MAKQKVIRPSAERPPCVYCGGSTADVKKGEHVVPAALGVNVTLRCVCQKCNGQFSELDKELTSHSLLGVLVRTTFGTRGDMCWGYDAKHDIALEARTLPGFAAGPLWPQLVILEKGTLFAFDEDDVRTKDVDALQTAFSEHLSAALRASDEKTKRYRFVWQKLSKGPDRGQFPPRVYTEHRFDEFKPGMQFKCRYLAGEDRDRILDRVRGWRPAKGTLEFEVGTPELRALSRYQPTLVLRGLVKIGVNLLAHLAGPEGVNRKRFPVAIAYVLRGRPFAPRDDRNGFVVNADVKQLGCPANCHCFVLRHDGTQWICDFAFFGGKLGARITFPGPLVADWQCATVTTPFAGEDRKWQY